MSTATWDMGQCASERGASIGSGGSDGSLEKHDLHAEMKVLMSLFMAGQ